MKFNGVAASAVTFVSATQLKATVPQTATSGPVTVTNTGAPVGTVRSASNYTLTPHVAPTVSSFTPASGITGSSVTITGTYFSGASAVKFGSLAASFSASVGDADQGDRPRRCGRGDDLGDDGRGDGHERGDLHADVVDHGVESGQRPVWDGRDDQRGGVRERFEREVQRGHGERGDVRVGDEAARDGPVDGHNRPGDGHQRAGRDGRKRRQLHGDAACRADGQLVYADVGDHGHVR